MKKLFLTFWMILFCISSVFSQFSEEEQKELYPEIYTFEKATEFFNNKEYEKAIWFYINLYPEFPTQAIEGTKSIAAILDTVNMHVYIVTAFSMYATFDPTIAIFTNGAPSFDLEQLQKKGAWGDELIRKIADPNKPLATANEYNLRGVDKSKIRDFEGALQDFNKAIELEENGQYYFNRAYTKSILEDFDAAKLDFDKAIELKYRLTESYFERGYCKDHLEDLDGAIADYTKAIKQDKNYVPAYNNRGFTKFKQKKLKAAIKDFDLAIKISPDYAGSYMNRGFVKNESGDKEAACKDWTKALELGFEPAKQVLSDICGK